MAMAKLVLMVLAILSGTALTVDAYLDSIEVDERPGYEMEMRVAPVSPDLLPLFETPCPQKLDTAADTEPVEEVLPAKSAAAMTRMSSSRRRSGQALPSCRGSRPRSPPSRTSPLSASVNLCAPLRRPMS